jgi:hypothetical protein
VIFHHHNHNHLSDIEKLLCEILFVLEKIYGLLVPQATTALLSTGEIDMATQAILTFVDGSGTTQSPPTGDGSGLVVTFASDNPAVTLGAATGSGDTATAPITGTAAFNLSATVANTSGVPLLDNDGVTPFIQPSSIPVAAVTPPAQATTAVLSVS